MHDLVRYDLLVGRGWGRGHTPWSGRRFMRVGVTEHVITLE